MHAEEVPQLTFDELDDCLYFSRANEAEDLWQTISSLADKYKCSSEAIILAAKDLESGNTILHYCSANGFLDLVRGLLARLDTQSQGAGQSDERETKTSLINAANKQGNTSLHWASLNGHLDVVKALVDAGADTLLKNTAGHSAAFEAEQAGKGLVVEYLMEVGGLETDAEDVVEGANGEMNGATSEDISDDMGDLQVDDSGPSG